jgi:hypothetical protein
MMQAWLFSETASHFWGPREIEASPPGRGGRHVEDAGPPLQAYLSGVKNSEMIVLDLWSESAPIAPRTKHFFGKPYIWCLLHNFGVHAGGCALPPSLPCSFAILLMHEAFSLHACTLCMCPQTDAAFLLLLP